VHFSYLARARHRGGGESRVAQLVSSPLCNQAPVSMRRMVRLSLSGPLRVLGRVLARMAGVPEPDLSWDLDSAPYFGNTLGEVGFDGRGARARWYHCARGGADALPEPRVSTDV
jgi:hypothetical protein